MGKRTGVEVRGDTIRIAFTWEGRRYREPYAHKATQTNIKRAERAAADIRAAIKVGQFDEAMFREYFPRSPRITRRGGTFIELAQLWLERFAAMAVAIAAATPAVGVADLEPKRASGLKPSRGRGNQGDWVTPIVRYAVSKEHQEHNAAIEAKRQAKLARRKARKEAGNE